MPVIFFIFFVINKFCWFVAIVIYPGGCPHPCLDLILVVFILLVVLFHVMVTVVIWWSPTLIDSVEDVVIVVTVAVTVLLVLVVAIVVVVVVVVVAVFLFLLVALVGSFCCFATVDAAVSC